MTALLAGFNPALVTTAPGQFNITSDGYTQGVALDHPAARYELRGGILSFNETIPMWGGVGIYENIPLANADILGPTVGRATTLTGASATSLTGFSVFNQAHNMINNPQSQVPTSASGMMVNFHRLGSLIEIVVACSPSLVSLDGSIITSQVSWDFGGQQLAPYVAAYAANVFTAMSWTAGTVTGTTTSAHGIPVGSVVTISGVTPAAYNGTYVTTAGTTGSTLKYALATNPGAVTTQGQINAGGGALPVKIKTINAASRVITYAPATNYATWSTGLVAVIQL